MLCNFRKDSEQTKQIEELQKQNEDLLDEKECLIEEIKRIVSETGKIWYFGLSDQSCILSLSGEKGDNTINSKDQVQV